MKVSDLFILIEDGWGAEEFAVPTGASLEIGNGNGNMGHGWKVGHRGSPLNVERPADRGGPLPRSRAIESTGCADPLITTALVRPPVPHSGARSGQSPGRKPFGVPGGNHPPGESSLHAGARPPHRVDGAP